jgi:hypothetical protein
MRTILIAMMLMAGVMGFSQEKVKDSLDIKIMLVEKELKKHKAEYKVTTDSRRKEWLYNHIMDDTWALRDLRSEKLFKENQ